MAANVVNTLGERNKKLLPALLGTDPDGGSTNIYSTDIGRFTHKNLNLHVLARGGSSYSTSLISGIVAQVPTNTTNGSTVPFYIQKLDPNCEIECSYSTLYSATHPADDYLGYYIGLSTAATIAGAVLSMGNVGTAPGTSDARFLKITGYSTERRKIYGFPSVESSCISW